MTNLEKGIDAFRSENYAEALHLLKLLAEEGNAEAQCIIANIYHLGLGIDKNGSEAIKWYTRSAEQGYAVASNNLAGIFLMGDCGVAANPKEAHKWYQLSQEQGFLLSE